MNKLNFCAGPAKLPEKVYQKLSQMVLNYEDSGVSLLSLSHRDPLFLGVYQRIIKQMRKLLHLSDDFEILLMPGGATLQFSAVALNLKQKGKAGYFNSGYWAKKAIDEAARFIDVACFLPDERISEQDQAQFDYVHYTDNETIDGFCWRKMPCVEVPLLCDMSSSFLSKPLDMTRLSLIYAGAQKNIGLPGTGLVIMRKSLLKKDKPAVPQLLDYDQMAHANSLYNTPNVIGWVTIELVLEHLIEQGGLSQVARLNAEKAALLYQYIDSSSLFYNKVAKPNRSDMNVVFQLVDEKLTDKFLAYAKAQDLYGLKGHRSLGGCRASLYNAVTLEEVKALIEVMKEFEKHAG